MTNTSQRGAEAARLSAFAAAMADARSAAGMSQEALGEAIRRKQGSVSRYEGGILEPDPLTVFAIERALGLDPGALSHYLGFMPLSVEHAPPVLPVLDAIEQDQRLTAQNKAMLIQVYRSAARLSNRLRAHPGEDDDEEQGGNLDTIGFDPPAEGDAPNGERAHSSPLPGLWRSGA